jgi:geranylgeranyl transferase type-2 subunit alpha
VTDQFSKGDLSSETLSLVTSVLNKNPEFYTFWNYRRKLVIKVLSIESDTNALIMAELQYLVPLLVQFPKCYWIWNYRIWLLEAAKNYTTIEDALRFWRDELALVGKMLNRDERNFHGWDYRRTVVSQIEQLQGEEDTSMVRTEFEYTTKMIRKALHNFSALHYRSKLIPRLLAEANAFESERRKMLETELDMMQEALVDPFNQSAWFYHAFLMNTLHPHASSSERILSEATDHDRQHYYQQEITRIKEMLEDFDDCKWIYQTLIQYSLDYRSFGKGYELSSKAELDSWLSELSKLDPARSGRWIDLKI